MSCIYIWAVTEENKYALSYESGDDHSLSSLLWHKSYQLHTGKCILNI